MYTLRWRRNCYFATRQQIGVGCVRIAGNRRIAAESLRQRQGTRIEVPQDRRIAAAAELQRQGGNVLAASAGSERSCGQIASASRHRDNCSGISRSLHHGGSMIAEGRPRGGGSGSAACKNGGSGMIAAQQRHRGDSSRSIAAAAAAYSQAVLFEKRALALGSSEFFPE